jgi:GxxExxY protein
MRKDDSVIHCTEDESGTMVCFLWIFVLRLKGVMGDSRLVYLDDSTMSSAGGTTVKENEIARIIVDTALEVHRELGGPGLLEDIYEEALAEELRLRGVSVQRQLPVPIKYKGRVLRRPLVLDMKVEGLVLVDNKAVVEWNGIFKAQMLTYLRLTKLRLGLVINFGERHLRDGIHRVVNGLPEDIDLESNPDNHED